MHRIIVLAVLGQLSRIAKLAVGIAVWRILSNCNLIATRSWRCSPHGHAGFGFFESKGVRLKQVPGNTP